MPTYYGGKAKLGKKIHDVITLIEHDLTNKNDLPYFEPMCGMCGILRHFGKEKRQVEACDINKDIILLLQAVQKDYKPPLTCTREEFEDLKHSKTHSADRGFIGTQASWSGIFFLSYRLHYRPDINYLEIGARALSKLKLDIETVNFLDARSYDEFEPSGKLIYCDIPYLNNTLKDVDKIFSSFYHDKFYEIARKWSTNNIVLISEKVAPRDFVCVWKATSTMSSGKRRKAKKYDDCLFIYNETYNKLSADVLEKIRAI